jgi:pilus assembly protein CpaC
LGFNWTGLNRDGTGIFMNKMNNLAQVVRPTQAQIGPNPPSDISPFGLALNQVVNGIIRFQTGNITMTGFIDALKQNNLVQVLAEPTLVALNGQEANFLAGGEFPFPVPQSFAVTTIKFKKFGVGLSFRPTVLGENQISVEVSPEVSELDYRNAVEVNGFSIPSITTRRAKTVLELKDGQSFAIGGLIRDNVREQISKFPVLGDVPVLGPLFRSSSFLKSETELVIIVTVHMVKPLNVVKQTDPTQFFVEPNDYEFYMEGKMEGVRQSVYGKSSVTSLARPSNNLSAVGLDGDFGHIWP